MTAEGAVLAGVVEATFRLFLPWYTSTGLHNIDPNAFWMAPVANFLLLLPITIAIAAGARLTGRRARGDEWMRAAAYSYAIAQGTLLISRLHAISSIILAIGVGTMLASVTARNRGRHVLRGTATLGAIAAMTWSITLPASRWIRYQVATRNLPAAPPGAPNVLLLILDTVSAREMSLYGYARRTTPVLDSLARHGAVFDRAISSAPWTLPSHASMFTGRPANELPTRFRVPLDDTTRVVAEAFSSAGYVTAGFVGNLEYASRASGLARGFHWYEDYVPSLGQAVGSTALGKRLTSRLSRWTGRPPAVGRKDAVEVNREFLAWQDGAKGTRPWFAFLNYYDAHDPYLPPRADEGRFMPPGRTPVYDVLDLKPTDTTSVSSARALHDAALFSLDRAIGRLLAELRARGELARTIIVVTSDHGEEWGGHGVLLHGNSVYLPAISVPLMVVYPGKVPAGVHVDDPVGTRNIGRTLLALAGVPDASLAGRSLSAYWEPGPRIGAQAAVLSWVEQAVNQPQDLPASRSDLYSVVTDEAQVILGADTVVFDLKASPDSAPDRARDPAFADDLRLALKTVRRTR